MNTECIGAYDKIANEVTFVEKADAQVQLQAYAQLGEILSRFIGSPKTVSRTIGESQIPEGDSISIPATDFEEIRKIIEEKRYLIADSTVEAWRSAKKATIANTRESVLDLRLLTGFEINVQYHLDFLRRQWPL